MIRLLEDLNNQANLSQRELAEKHDISLGNVNKQIKLAETKGYLSREGQNLFLTQTGKSYLENYRVDNAIILAAGIGSRFVPFTYETPKGLMPVFGEPLIERTIKQLQEKGITEIIIVVGYMKEKFEYLIDAYGVKLVFNAEYAVKNNLASLYLVRKYIKNSYILCSDNWIRHNMFHTYEDQAWYSLLYAEGETAEWQVTVGRKNKIEKVEVGGEKCWFMYGPVFFSQEFSKRFLPLMETYYHRKGTENAFWEDIVKDHISELDIYANYQKNDNVYEFESYEELRNFDTSYANNLENDCIRLIADVLEINPSEITNIECMKAGMTNQSFRFDCRGETYIFRKSGPGTNLLIDRKNEWEINKVIAPLNVSDELVTFDPKTGNRISKFIHDCRAVNSENWDEIGQALGMIRNLHEADIQIEKEFSFINEIEKYERLCREQGEDAILFQDYKKVKASILEILAELSKLDVKKCFCHVDCVADNYLILPNGDMKLIDWEYAGLCDPLVDPAMFSIYVYFNEAETNKVLEVFLQREPTQEEWFRYYAYVSLGGFLWSLWTCYKIALGVDFGDYGLIMYRYGKDYSKKALKVKRGEK